MSYCMYTTQGDITCNNTGLNHNQDLLANFPSVPPVHRAINSNPNPYPLTYVPNLISDSLARNPPIPNLISDHLARIPPIPNLIAHNPPVPNLIAHNHPVPNLIAHNPPVPNLISRDSPVPNLIASIPPALTLTPAPVSIPIPDPFVRASDLFVPNPN